jgi:hypothetical protein
MDPMVIGNAKRPRCFGKDWCPTMNGVLYEHNKKAWMDGRIFSKWISLFDRLQQRRLFATERRALLLLDNSSTHVIPEGCVACTWEVSGFKFRGFKMEKTDVVFNLPNTTSEVQALDAGIIMSWKAKVRARLLTHIIEHLDADEALSADNVKQDIQQAITWTKDAWNDASSSTIINCWNKIGILPRAIHDVSPPEDDVSELSSLLLQFAQVAGMETCSAEELFHIPAERWTEDPDSDDDDSELAQAITECPEPTGGDAVEDDSVEIKCMTLKEARLACAGLFHFLQENGSAQAGAQAEISKELSNMTLTVHHHQSTLLRWFKPATKPQAPSGDGGCPP